MQRPGPGNFNIRQELRDHWPQYLPITIATFMLLYTAITGILIPGGGGPEVRLLFSDPLGIIWGETEHKQPYLTIFSQLGSVMWLSGAIICGFSVLLHHRLVSGEAQMRRLLITVSLIGFMMGFDDLFLIHERLAPEYLSLAERKVLLGYVLLFLGIGIGLRHDFLANKPRFLIVALFFLGISLGVDQISDQLEEFISRGERSFLEDGAKFIGITAFWTYCMVLSYHALTRTTEG